MAPAQDLHQARHQLPQTASRGTARRRTDGRADLARSLPAGPHTHLAAVLAWSRGTWPGGRRPNPWPTLVPRPDTTNVQAPATAATSPMWRSSELRPAGAQPTRDRQQPPSHRGAPGSLWLHPRSAPASDRSVSGRIDTTTSAYIHSTTTVPPGVRPRD